MTTQLQDKTPAELNEIALKSSGTFDRIDREIELFECPRCGHEAAPLLRPRIGLFKREDQPIVPYCAGCGIHLTQDAIKSSLEWREHDVNIQGIEPGELPARCRAENIRRVKEKIELAQEHLAFLESLPELGTQS